ncbi:MAG: putative metallopeptidase [Bdellovibrionota bacterium]
MLLRFKILITLFLLITGCGKAPVVDVGEFEPYVNRFEARSAMVGAPIRIEQLIIKFGEMESPTERGICEILGDNTPTIKINKEAWDTMTEEEKESLIFHEMGHCVLRRKHKKEMDANGQPVSLMSPYMIDPMIYKYNAKYYYKELFSSAHEF